MTIHLEILGGKFQLLGTENIFYIFSLVLVFTYQHRNLTMFEWNLYCIIIVLTCSKCITFVVQILEMEEQRCLFSHFFKDTHTHYTHAYNPY